MASVGEGLSVVGHESGLPLTNLLTLRPRTGYHWLDGNVDVDFQEAFARKGFFVTCIPLGAEQWVRVAVNFFMDWRASMGSFPLSMARVGTIRP